MMGTDEMRDKQAGTQAAVKQLRAVTYFLPLTMSLVWVHREGFRSIRPNFKLVQFN